MNAEHDKFGSPCGGSRWFNSEPKITERVMVPVEEHWSCPVENCDGEMKFNGMTWPTGNPGYHHTCDKCGFTAAISGKRYPRIAYRASDFANKKDHQ